MFCTKCGAESREASKFCTKCGKPLFKPEQFSGAAHQGNNKALDNTVPQEQVPKSKQTPAQPASLLVAEKQTSTLPTGINLPENISGAICYLVGWLSGIALLIICKRDRFVLFHAWQSIIIFGLLTLVIILMNFIPPVPAHSFQYWLIYVLQVLIALLVVFLWFFLSLQAYLGRQFGLPLIGKLAANLSDKGN